MTGESLHTKYRPASLDDVVGQDHIKNGLSAVLAEGKQRAFLFEGPSGTGKTTLARICASQLGASEVIEIDAATNTGVDDMRKVSESARYVSLDGGGKAFIIDECHRLSKQAWDSLLKDIEEPPAGVTWFFCTTEGNKVPATINTRCAVYSLKEVGYRPILRLLSRVVEAEGIVLPEDVLDVAASEAGGSPRRALVNLTTVKHAQSAAEAQAALNRATGSKEAVDLARLLSRDWSMADAMKILVDLGDESPESVRMTVFHYHMKIALGGNMKSLVVLDEFEKTADDRHKMGDIILRLARIKKRERT